jgi:flagellar hook-length control protein FliK
MPVTPASAPAAPSAAAPAPMPASAPLPVCAVGLEHAVETVRLALRHGAERGVTHARISLTPRELGTVEVHLRQTADGLVARVVAEHAGAVQQLQQAGAELRRSLEQQGLTLLRLDIGASGDEAAGRRGAASDSAAAFGDGDGRRGDGTDPLGSLDDIADADPATATTTLQLPNGALVDVLA